MFFSIGEPNGKKELFSSHSQPETWKSIIRDKTQMTRVVRCVLHLYTTMNTVKDYDGCRFRTHSNDLGLYIFFLKSNLISWSELSWHFPITFYPAQSSNKTSCDCNYHYIPTLVTPTLKQYKLTCYNRLLCPILLCIGQHTALPLL